MTLFLNELKQRKIYNLEQPPLHRDAGVSQPSTAL